MSKKWLLNRDIQRKAREPVHVDWQFKFFGKTILVKLDSEKGLIFDNKFEESHFSGHLVNHNRHRLFYQGWFVDRERPTIFFVHGSAENSSTHPLFVYNCLANGFNFFSFDQEGYGSSDGIRGTFKEDSDYTANLKIMLDLAISKFKENYGIAPNIYTCASSAGCPVLLESLIQHRSDNIKKVFLFSPYLKNNRKVIKPWLEFILGLLNFKPLPLIRESSQLLINMGDEENYCRMNKNISDNDIFLKRRFTDTRIHRINSYKWISSMIKRQNRILKSARRFKDRLFDIPVYGIICEEDNIVENSKTVEFMNLIGQKKNLYRKSDFSHEFLDYEDKRGELFYKLFNYLIS